MPKYKVRLESPDDNIRKGVPHFRVTSLEAPDAAAAKAACERMEYKKAAYQLPSNPDADEPVEGTLEALEAAEADAQDRGVKPDAQVRMRLAIHRQARPYEVVSVEEV